MADSTLTTVVVISHNYGRFLQTAVESAVRQTTRPHILIIDDASMDETPRIAERLVNEHGGIESRRLSDNAGLARVRNLAADLVRTDWLVYLDADDWLDPSYVERAEAWLAAHEPVDVLTTDMTIVRDGRAHRVVRARVPTYWTDLLRRNTIVQTSFIRPALVRRVGGYDPLLEPFEDWDFWIRVVQSGGRIARLPGAHVNWRQHGENMSKLCDEAAVTAAIRRKHAHSP